MKNQLHLITLGTALVMAGSFASAAEEKAAGKRSERHIVVHSTATSSSPGAEPVTFLGVSAVNAPPVLAAQLKLAEGHGLVVGEVVPDSPAAAAGLQRHDLLLKLDDQVLVDQRQLSVLVRARKEGDKVTLTYLRGGVETRAIVTLAKRELPRERFEFAPMEWNGHERAFRFFEEAGPGKGIDVLKFRENLPHPGAEMLPHPGAPGARRLMIFPPSTIIVMMDDDGMLELHVEQDLRTLVAKGADGTVLFDGPVNTPEQRKALPEGLRERLEKLERMQVAEPPAPPEAPARALAPAAPAPVVLPRAAPLTGNDRREVAPEGCHPCFRRAMRHVVS